MRDSVRFFYRTNAAYPIAWIIGLAWQVLPCTLAVFAGPLITVVYRLTRPEDAEPGSFSLAQVLRGLLCLAMFLSLFLSKRLSLLEHRIIRPLMFLAMYALLTCVLSHYPYENIVFVVQSAFTMLVFANAFSLAQSKSCSENWLVGNAWIVLILMTISQVIGLVTENTVAVYKSDYATAGLINQPAVTAVLIISTLPVFLRSFPKSRNAMIGVIVLLVSLFFTMRRTSIIAASLTTLIILASNIHPLRRRIPWRQGLLVFMILCVLFMIGWRSQAGQDLLNRFRGLKPAEGGGSGRYSFWLISLKHISTRRIEANIFGEGMGSIRDVMEMDFGHRIGSHTDWLDIPQAFGIFGLIAFMWWYIELIRFITYLRSNRSPAFPGTFSAIIVLFLISIGQGQSSYNPSLALTYAALGFWAGLVSYRSPICQTCS